MIKRLKKKFTILATLSMLLLMVALVTIMNLVNYVYVVMDCNMILDVISKPDFPIHDFKDQTEKMEDRIREFLPKGMSPEVPYESRFFVAIINDEGEIINTNITRIAAVDNASIEEYVNKAYESKRDNGFIDAYRYVKTTDGIVTNIYFLDCGRKLEAFDSFVKISIIVGLMGCVIVFFIFLFFAERIVKPIAESYEKQKRFITDAGHEIKTPLTIINANVDIIESDMGETEELHDIREETVRLTKLTNDLVYLSKMEESDNGINKIEFSLSEVATDIAESIMTVAVSQNKKYEMNIEPSVNMKGSPDDIRRLISILLDNAVKYASDNGIVKFDLSKHKKGIVIYVFNSTNNVIENKDLDHIFDRFYRTDTSRNSETGGHGIGLSIAKVIVENHGGKIKALTDKESGFAIIVNLPV